MAVDVDIDVGLLKSEIRKTYADVSQQPEKDFMFPTGRGWAEDLEYPAELLARVPESAVESFAGVANPYSLGELSPGEHVLDLGSGAGMDSLVAALMVGPEGQRRRHRHDAGDARQGARRSRRARRHPCRVRRGRGGVSCRSRTRPSTS